MADLPSVTDWRLFAVRRIVPLSPKLGHVWYHEWARTPEEAISAVSLSAGIAPDLLISPSSETAFPGRTPAPGTPWDLALKVQLATLAALCLLLALALPARAAEDDFHRLSLSAYALMAPGAPTIPTHLCVTGDVRYVRKERDGDVHIRLCDGALCVVAEIIPLLPLDRPRKSQRVEACGITRWDGWPGHGWAELHPLLSWRSAP